MQKNLVIVESPAKAKTIGKFLGKDFQVLSSYGHIRDLKKHSFGIDITDQYKPEYEVPAEKKTLVSELRKAAKAAEVVWLASDEDREGEAIAWHLSEVLGLKGKTTHRIVFHEITESAIRTAVETPRSIDTNLVDAQQARRILDRIVGFELSPVLWRRIKTNLSAGRVQSVAVRLIVEREREINAFEGGSAFRVQARFLLPNTGVLLEAELNHRFETETEAHDFLTHCAGEKFCISEVSKKPGKRSPAPPFTTSTLQQEAARKLGYSVTQTMRVAQKLYEAGHITYMRTDSVSLSKFAIETISEEIKRQWGEDYLQVRGYRTKSKGAQEAHEAIRPTYVERGSAGSTPQERTLYELIRKRTIASQMADAQIERTVISIPIAETNYAFIARGEVVTFPGFIGVYRETTEEETLGDENKLLPAVSIGEDLTLNSASADERYTRHPARYTEAALVRKMEELGIGRPSTYAPTIQTIQSREYVIKGDRPGKTRKIVLLDLIEGKIDRHEAEEVYDRDNGKLLPTDIGIVVNDFLVQSFPRIVDLGFTARVEEQFDNIAEGKIKWSNLINDFYENFHPTVEAAMSFNPSDGRVGERFLGDDPKTGLPVSVRIGRYGPMAILGSASKNEEETDNEQPKVRFASLPKGKSLETITIDEALRLFSLPRHLGTFEDREVVVSAGRFGPYVLHNGKYVSLPKDVDPIEIQLDDAVSLIHSKREADAKSLLKTFPEDEDLQIRNGRYGNYIRYKGENYKLPKDKADDIESLCYNLCMQIIANTPAKTKTGKKKAGVPTAAKTKKTGAKKPSTGKKPVSRTKKS